MGVHFDQPPLNQNLKSQLDYLEFDLIETGDSPEEEEGAVKTKTEMSDHRGQSCHLRSCWEHRLYTEARW